MSAIVLYRKAFFVIVEPFLQKIYIEIGILALYLKCAYVTIF